MTPAEKFPNREAAGFTVVQRTVVYIHADEFIRQGAVEPSPERQGVLHACGAMLEAIRDASAKDGVDLRAVGGRDVLADDVPSQRQRQAGLRKPPRAEIQY